MRRKLFLRFLWVLGTLLALVIGLVGQSIVNHRRHLITQEHITEQVRIDINANSISSSTMGAATMLGLASERLKSALLKPTPADAAPIREEFRNLLAEYDADIAYIANDHGIIVQYYNRLNPMLGPGADVSFRPYWKQSLRGMKSVYPAVGVTDGN